MFGFGGVFGRKPRQFNYRPLYYDPEKEAREQRRRELRMERGAEEEPADETYVPGSIIRGRMGSLRRTQSVGREKSRRMQVRMLVVLGVLILLLVLLFR